MMGGGTSLKFIFSEILNLAVIPVGGLGSTEMGLLALGLKL
jgi:hypothetical protein